MPAVSIFKAVKDNNIDLVRYLAGPGTKTNQSPNVTKEDQQWLRIHLKTTGQKHYNLNKRSSRGKTALHYAVQWNRISIAQCLIECPMVNINLQDSESGWTALHRALYLGNIEIALLLVQREGCNLSIKDWDGLSPFELYNLTVKDTLPVVRMVQTKVAPRTVEWDFQENPQQHFETIFGGTDLYSWGVNTNYVLGLPDSDNKTRPERVHLNLESQMIPEIIKRPPYLIRTVAMSKYHTAILTSESRNNLLLCGFGRGGRLGTGKLVDTQLTPVAMQWPESIVAVALGRDHTVAVSKTGNVITFGNNRFGQLGCETEVGEDETPMQLVPRKVQAASLKRIPIIGAAASSVHSVVYTFTDIYTFGYNQGQLGYSCLGDDVCQTTPKKVPFTTTIIDVVATDYATAVLFSTNQAIILYNYGQHKLILPWRRFPSEIEVHKPSKNLIVKLLGSGGDHMGAISSLGEVFIWTCSNTTTRRQNESTEAPGRSKTKLVTMSSPRIVWTPRMAHLEARRASIGQNGEVILCTASGEVYIGAPARPNEGSEYKFSKIQALQRCINVFANPSGAFAALCAEHKVDKQQVVISDFSNDLVSALPHKVASKRLEEQMERFEKQKRNELEALCDTDEDNKDTRAKVCREYDGQVETAVQGAWRTVESLSRDDTLDLVFVVQNKPIYLHRSFLSTRWPFIIGLIDQKASHPQLTVIENPTRTEIHIDTHLESFLLLVDYLYSDRYPHPMSTQYQSPALCRGNDIPVVRPLDVQKSLVELASQFDLVILLDSAQSSFNHTPQPSLLTDVESLLTDETCKDVQLNLKDGILVCHELIVRQRCPFFEALFCPGSVWMQERRRANQKHLPVELRHIPIAVMEPILDYLYTGHDEERLFGNVAKSTSEKMIEFLSEVLCVADELLLPELKALCERSLADFVGLKTCVGLLERADLCLAENLRQNCLGFICANLSTFVTCGMLEYTDSRLVGYLEEYVQKRQARERRSLETQTDSGVDFQDREMDDPEFSTSVYALSLEDVPVISSQRDILVTVYPKKCVPDNLASQVSLAIKDKKPKTHVSSQRESRKRGVRLDLCATESEIEAIANNLKTSHSRQGWAMPVVGVLAESCKPSLREILEQEPQTIDLSSSISPPTQPKSGLGLKKVSQKERRRLQQQQEEEAIAQSSAKAVWGKLTKTEPQVSQTTGNWDANIIGQPKGSKGKQR
ncbi:hypothetical protein CLU79DRAFT_755882 [Phycomyces nitens]|nr:hypothetical protein CLU79DRAFT_755882 [Phycomyces nitens]